MSQGQGVDLSYEDGARAVELARESVDSYVRHGQREQPGSMREAFYERTGAFVRLESTRGRGACGAVRVATTRTTSSATSSWTRQSRPPARTPVARR